MRFGCREMETGMSSEKGSLPSRDDAWIDRLSSFTREWQTQRALMEAQLDALKETLYAQSTPENRAMRTLVDAQCIAIRALFEARADAAKDLLIAREAAQDFFGVAGSHALDALPGRLARVARILFEAQEGAAEILLAAQTTAAEELRSERDTAAQSLLADQAETAAVLRSQEDAEAESLLAGQTTTAETLRSKEDAAAESQLKAPSFPQES
jgi:hypothetical protein